jgi:hypothetical protein
MNLNQVPNCPPDEFLFLVNLELDKVSNNPIESRKMLKKTLNLINEMLKNEWTFPHALYLIQDLKAKKIPKEISSGLEMIVKNQPYSYWFKDFR